MLSELESTVESLSDCLINEVCGESILGSWPEDLEIFASQHAARVEVTGGSWGMAGSGSPGPAYGHSRHSSTCAASAMRRPASDTSQRDRIGRAP